MKLVASLLVHNELDRYLALCVESLLEFCDEVRVLDDASTDGSPEILESLDRVAVLRRPEPEFFKHEGRTRQALLDWTLEAEPTHILAIDADEFVAEPDYLLSAIRRFPHAPAFSLCMEEVWKADKTGYRVRCDGGWCPHETPSCYAVPPPRLRGPEFRILDRALACGREPVSVREGARRRGHGRVYSETALLHLGWTREAERVARHRRYAVADKGRFHASSHLASILFPDDRILLEERPAPPLAIWDEIAAAANRSAVPSDSPEGGVDPLPGA